MTALGDTIAARRCGSIDRDEYWNAMRDCHTQLADYTTLLKASPVQRIELTADGRKSLVQAYIARKREEVTHPVLGTKVRVGQLPFLQAKLLARHLRGDAEGYPPCILR